MSRLIRFYWCWTILVTSLVRLSSPALTDGEKPEPEFIDQLGNVTIAQGRDAILSCSVAHLNDYTVGWVKVDTKAIQATGRRIVTLNIRVSVENIPGSPVWKLIIKSAQPDDAGYYMAQINTDPMKSQIAYLSVMEPPNIDDEATPSVRQVRENESVELYCQASGQPMPNITFKREDGTNISSDSCHHLNDNKIRKLQKNASLTGSLPRGFGRFCIASTGRSSMGTYLCIASNGILPAVSKRIQLVVLFPATTKAEKALVGVPAGVNGVGLECIVEASPMTHHLFWYRGNYSLSSTERFSLTTQKINVYTIKMTLAILNTREEDMGPYRCQAGKSEATIRLYMYPSLTTTTQSTTIEQTIATGTSPWQPARTSPTEISFQTSTITTEASKSAHTPHQHIISDEADVLNSNKRPAKDMINKNVPFQRGQSSSSSASKLIRFDLVELLLIPSIITSFNQMISFILGKN